MRLHRTADDLAYFSNWGAKSVDIAAPGTNIYSTVPTSTWAYKQGTSMATPHVAGAAAIVRSLPLSLILPTKCPPSLNAQSPLAACFQIAQLLGSFSSFSDGAFGRGWLRSSAATTWLVAS